MSSFFLRFYAQPESQVQENMEEYRRMFPSCIGYTVEPITRSVNITVPKNSWQVLAQFETEAEMMRVRGDKTGQLWYQPRAYPKGGATFKLQGKTDKSYVNPIQEAR